MARHSPGSCESLPLLQSELSDLLGASVQAVVAAARADPLADLETRQLETPAIVAARAALASRNVDLLLSGHSFDKPLASAWYRRLRSNSLTGATGCVSLPRFRPDGEHADLDAWTRFASRGQWDWRVANVAGFQNAARVSRAER